MAHTPTVGHDTHQMHRLRLQQQAKDSWCNGHSKCRCLHLNKASLCEYTWHRGRMYIALVTNPLPPDPLVPLVSAPPSVPGWPTNTFSTVPAGRYVSAQI